MPGPVPERIIVEYGDGTRVGLPFAELPSSLREDILRQPEVARPSPVPGSDRFVLVEWDDGWREVFAVAPTCEAVNRYYVISRQEEVGRLSLDTSEGYPQLIQIARRPSGVKRIVFGESYGLALRSSEREGKKTDHWYSLEPEGDVLAEARDAVRSAAAAEGVSLDQLRGGGATPDQQEKSWAVAKRIGLTAGYRQQDLYDFLAFLAAEEA
jgi:hypothetical protein